LRSTAHTFQEFDIVDYNFIKIAFFSNFRFNFARNEVLKTRKNGKKFLTELKLHNKTDPAGIDLAFEEVLIFEKRNN
jgi:hypothetical protein